MNAEATVVKVVMIAVVVVCMAAAAVMAQENDPAITPDNIDKPPESRPIVEYVLAGGFLLGALAIGFMPSKRIKDS